MSGIFDSEAWKEEWENWEEKPPTDLEIQGYYKALSGEHINGSIIENLYIYLHIGNTEMRDWETLIPMRAEIAESLGIDRYNNSWINLVIGEKMFMLELKKYKEFAGSSWKDQLYDDYLLVTKQNRWQTLIPTVLVTNPDREKLVRLMFNGNLRSDWWDFSIGKHELDNLYGSGSWTHSGYIAGDIAISVRELETLFKDARDIKRSGRSLSANQNNVLIESLNKTLPQSIDLLNIPEYLNVFIAAADNLGLSTTSAAVVDNIISMIVDKDLIRRVLSVSSVLNMADSNFIRKLLQGADAETIAFARLFGWNV